MATSISAVTQRFLECLDLLIQDGKVRSKRQFALSIGYHPQGISEMSAQRRDATLDLIEMAIRNFRFNPYYLFTGQGKPFTSVTDDDGIQVRNLSIVTDQKGEERIVHVPYPAQAGYGQQLDDPLFISELPTYQLPDPQFRSGTYRSFEISGHSMEPTFKPNDIVIAAYIEPRFWEQAIKNNQVYIIVTPDEVVIKRIINRIKSDLWIECCSDNPEYHPYTIAAGDIREIWKARMKVTSHIDMPQASWPDQHISQQLQVQHKMLESLHQHLTSTKS